eukprot:10388617-Alexandrium_andersonii.AAC.1
MCIRDSLSSSLSDAASSRQPVHRAGDGVHCTPLARVPGHSVAHPALSYARSSPRVRSWGLGWAGRGPPPWQ